MNAVKPNHPFHNYVEVILQKVPVELREKMARRQQVDSGSGGTLPTEKALVRLHKQVGNYT